MTESGRHVGLSDTEKAAITNACQRFIDELLKPRFLPTIRPTQFNYPIDILGKWHGNRYRFVQRYRSGYPDNLGEEFEAPFTRLDWMGRDRFESPMASTHGHLVLPLSRPVTRRGPEDNRTRWSPPPTIAVVQTGRANALRQQPSIPRRRFLALCRSAAHSCFGNIQDSVSLTAPCCSPSPSPHRDTRCCPSP
jgi:hypothetical protein